MSLESFWNIPSSLHIPAQGFFWDLHVYIKEEMRKKLLVSLFFTLSWTFVTAEKLFPQVNELQGKATASMKH